MSEAILGTLLFGSFTGSQIASSKSQTKERKRAEAQAADTQRRQDEQIKKLESQQADIDKRETEDKVRSAAKDRQRKAAAGSQGRRSTILTSPLGLPGGGSQAGTTKSLLGT